MNKLPDGFTGIRATYRLQFHRHFTFRDATGLPPYGYDIIDHNQLNPEIDSKADFQSLIDALHAHGMGLILDCVPNHMGVGGNGNAWWLNVLEWGQIHRSAPILTSTGMLVGPTSRAACFS
jgi:(1->4)-alpha-D-glucan 1-alpha-D-glucosylmutase